MFLRFLQLSEGNKFKLEAELLRERQITVEQQDLHEGWKFKLILVYQCKL